MKQHVLARDLAVFSIGLGLAELLAPRKVAELIGLNDEHDNLLRILGAREIASGLGIMQGNPSHFLWSRVGGDMLDLGLLLAALRDERNDREKLQVALASVAAVTALDLLASLLHSRDHSDSTWRVRAPGSYERAISDDDPESLRASADDAMRHQSGHVYRGSGDTASRRRDEQQFPVEQ